MAEIKMNEMDKYEAIKSYIAGEVELADEVKDALIDFCDAKVKQLESKRMKAAEKRQSKDTLTEAVRACLSSEYKTIQDILEELDDESATANKIANRCKKLIDAGIAERGTVKVDKKSKVAYKLVV